MKSLSLTIQKKPFYQYFPVVLFIMLCKVVLPLGLWMKSQKFNNRLLCIMRSYALGLTVVVVDPRRLDLVCYINVGKASGKYI